MTARSRPWSFAFLNRVANPLVRAVLRSPLHGTLDRSLLLITVTGRRSGRTITFPTQYVRDGDRLWIFAGQHSAKQWWRNLIGGGRVRVRLRGRDLQADAHVVDGRENADEAAEGLRAFGKRWPKVAARHQDPSRVMIVRVGPIPPES